MLQFLLIGIIIILEELYIKFCLYGSYEKWNTKRFKELKGLLNLFIVLNYLQILFSF